MHQYSVDNSKRKTVLYWIVAVSVIFSTILLYCWDKLSPIVDQLLQKSDLLLKLRDLLSRFELIPSIIQIPIIMILGSMIPGIMIPGTTMHGIMIPGITLPITIVITDLLTWSIISGLTTIPRTVRLTVADGTGTLAVPRQTEWHSPVPALAAV